MNVQQISSINCKANPLKNASKLNFPLKDGREAVLRLNKKAYECYILKDGAIVDGRGQYSSQNIQPQDWSKLFTQLSQQVKDSVDFTGKFFNELLTK